MSTEATIQTAHETRNSTQQHTISLNSIAASLAACDLPNSSAHIPSSTWIWTAPKSVEAGRQINRLAAARSFAEGRHVREDDIESINACVSMIGHFASTPVPIPVASWTAGKGASLFFDMDGFYGDLEVDGTEVEYFLKWSDGTHQQEVFDSEAVEDGKIPPRLLVHLFKVFARHNAAVL